MRVIEFVEFFRCWKCFSVEDVFVGDVEDAFEIGLDVVDELVVFVVGDVSGVCEFAVVVFGVFIGGVLCVGFVEVPLRLVLMW